MVALAVGALFGLVRGLAVLLGRHVTSFETLARLHRRMAELDGPSVVVVVAAEVAVAALGGWLLSPWVAAAVVAPAAIVTLRRARHRLPLGSRAARA